MLAFASTLDFPTHVNPCEAESVYCMVTEGEATLDETAIREFLHTGYPRLVSAVAMMCGSRPAAEDAVQEALARAWERSERGQPIDSLTAWVTTVAVNLAKSGLRRLRTERRARERLVRIPTGGDSPADAGDRVDVLRALAELPRRQREATVLRYYLGLDVSDVARVLHVREGTVKTTLHRARLALATHLSEKDLEEANESAR